MIDPSASLGTGISLARRCAGVALAAYTSPASIETDVVHALIVEAPDLTIVGLRGTDPWQLIDLFIDAAAAVERDDPILGRAPASFLADAEQLFWRLLPKLPADRPFAIAGHSKGASEAQLLAAMFKAIGRPAAFLGAFEPAAVGLLNGLLSAGPGLATRHGLDPITDLPPGRAHAQILCALPWLGPPARTPLDYHSMQGVNDALYCWQPPAS